MSGHDEDGHVGAPYAEEGYPDERKRNVGLASLLGLLLGGIAMFYVLPPKRALKWFLVTATIDVATLGMMIVPVHMTCALAAAYFARMSLPRFAFSKASGGEEYDRTEPSMQPHPPHTYFRIRQAVSR